jgi:hypothetical protein
MARSEKPPMNEEKKIDENISGWRKRFCSSDEKYNFAVPGFDVVILKIFLY